jgi:hypothetical protein
MVRKAVALLYIVLGVLGVYALFLYAPVFFGKAIGSIDTLEEIYVLVFNVPTVLVLFVVPLSLVVLGVISVLRRAVDVSPLVNLLFLIPLVLIMSASVALPIAVLTNDTVREILQSFISNVHL